MEINNININSNNSQKNLSVEENLFLVHRSLGKLSKDNHQVLSEQIISKCQELDRDSANEVITQLYSKVVTQPILLPYISQICSKLSPLFLHKLHLSMGDRFIELYYQEFSNVQAILHCSPQSNITESKTKIIHASRFLAECYRFNILGATFFSDIISTFLPKDSSQTSEHSEFTLLQIESLGVIATIVGRSIESSNKSGISNPSNLIIQQAIEDGFQLIQSLSENRNVRPQTRYMLKNLIELKNNHWVLPNQALFHQEQEILQKEIIDFAEEVGKSINKFLASHCTKSETAQLFWKKLLQSISTNNYSLFKETIIEDTNSSPTSAPVVPLSPWLRRASARPPLSPVNSSEPNSFSLLNPMTNNNSNQSSTNKHNIQKLNLTDIQQQQQYPMDIDDNFSLGSNNNSNSASDSFMLSGNQSGLQQQFKPLNNLVLRNIDSNLPAGFISPKLPRSDSSPTLTNNLLNSNSNNSNSNGQPIANINSTNSFGYRESPELKLTPASNNLSVILSIIDSKIIGPRDIWKKKIMNKIVEIKASLKKNNKTEILAAIWQNMCDNKDDYVSYLDLCFTLIQMDEEDNTPPPEPEQKHFPNTPFNLNNNNNSNNISINNNNINSISMSEEPVGSGRSSDMALEHPAKKKIQNRRSSVAVVQMSNNNLAQSIMARRSSIASASELTRRGSMCEDTPNICPPAPKLKSTPTLQSVSHKAMMNAAINSNSNNSITSNNTNSNNINSNSINSNNNNNHTTINNNINHHHQNHHNNSNHNNHNINNKTQNTNQPIVNQPIAKKHKTSNGDTFRDVLVTSLQDDLALKMFIKKKSLIVYFDLLKDLYREFVIEIPLLLRCISLIQIGLYELSDEECMTLFELEEMAQVQQNLEKQNHQKDSMLRNQNQFFQWKTNTWQERPPSPPPPPNSFFDLASDVFVL